jgi:hypothetical protein
VKFQARCAGVVVGRHANGAQALQEVEQIVRFIAQDTLAISSRADGIGETEGKVARGSGERAGKRVSFNQQSAIRNQTSDSRHQMVALWIAIRLPGSGRRGDLAMVSLARRSVAKAGRHRELFLFQWKITGVLRNQYKFFMRIVFAVLVILCSVSVAVAGDIRIPFSHHGRIQNNS